MRVRYQRDFAAKHGVGLSTLRKWLRVESEALAESKLSAWFLRQIGLLYAVEKLLCEKKAGPRLRAATRNWQSRPVLAEINQLRAFWPRTVRRRFCQQHYNFVLFTVF